jgi:hypothetical protein
MEPLSLTAGAIATLVLTKALEKTGEVLGEKAIAQSGKLWKQLQGKSPETASAIERVQQQPELMELQPEEYGPTVLEAKVVEAAEGDAEIKATLEALAEAVKSQPQIVENWKGINIKGGSPQISGNTFTFS